MSELSHLAASATEEEERAELDAVAGALSRSPRLCRLVRYMGEKYFQGELDELHEYNIATEVFGRSRSAFNPGEDAIARVEAHRLRKRLKEFYEGDGRDHPIQLTIPPGTYVPVFARRPATELQEQPPAEEPQAGPDAIEPPAVPVVPAQPHLVPGRRLWIFALAAAALALLVLGSARWLRRGAGTPQLSASGTPAAPSQPAAAPAGAAPVRIMCGYFGKPQTDSSGAVWTADRYFYGGGAWSRPGGPVARTSDPLLFEHQRNGDFFYNIPLRPGVYELHLFFIASDETLSTFTVLLNGQPLLQGFDVNSDALGSGIADERVFRDVSPEKDGFLHLSFTGERGVPALNAIEILPGLPHQQLPIRLVTQPASFTDHSGNLWRPDSYYSNGQLSTQRAAIAGTPDPDLFASERFGHFTYAIPVDTRDRYTVVLHFAEFYFGPNAPGGGGTGSRVFRVLCNGQTLLDNFDIYRQAGSLHALTETFHGLRPSAQGKLNLTFEPVVNNATVSGIEVFDDSRN